MTELTIALIGVCVLIAVGLLFAVRSWQRKRLASLVVVSTKNTLEALIPAIMDIERGYHEHVVAFLSDANKGLERVGSPYRFTATFTIKRSWDVTGKFVDTISVVEAKEGDGHE